MPAAAFLVIDEQTDGTVLLYRYDATGDFAGDTFHLNVAEAKEQAAFEFENPLGNWQEIPPEVQDIAAWGSGALWLDAIASTACR